MSNPDTHPESSRPALSPEEARVLDALMESISAGHSCHTYESDAAAAREFPAAAPGSEAARVQACLKLIAHCPCEAPSLDLTQKTLERIAEVRRKQWFAEQAQALAAPRGGMGWNNVGAIAAMLLISASLIWPVLGRVRSDSRRIACATNLESAGMAMGSYANDNNDHLPRRGSSAPGTVWWNVGKEQRGGEPIQSNSAHLYALVRGGYIAPEGLNCPENQQAPRFMTRQMNDWSNAAAVSYSYQNQYAPRPTRVDRNAKMAVLADKNPLFAGQAGRVGLKYRSDLPSSTPSNFHLASGQNILMLNGGVIWSNQPILPNGDNIWLAKGVKDYTGTETPADASDSFLVP
jgi:hypothetical protein